MKFLKKIICLISVAAFVSSCSSMLMVKSESDLIAAPSEEYAMVVFMRTSMTLAAVNVELFEVNEGELSFVGSLPNGSKIAYLTKPGKKVFMAYGQKSAFMPSEVEAGKTYYVIVKPTWGSGAFNPTPVRTDGQTSFNTDAKGFDTWLNKTSLLVKVESSGEWFEKKHSKFSSIYKKSWSKFLAKHNKSSDIKKREVTLTLADGVSI